MYVSGISLLESMNFKIDPCQNFYDFACGSWTHSSPGEHNVPLVVNSDQFSKINEKVIRATQSSVKIIYKQCRMIFAMS